MSTLSCSLKYSSVNESVLHSHCRLKLLLACFPFAFVQVSLWKESLEGQWVENEAGVDLVLTQPFWLYYVNHVAVKLTSIFKQN